MAHQNTHNLIAVLERALGADPHDATAKEKTANDLETELGKYIEDIVKSRLADIGPALKKNWNLY
jgi:hypothetical protein